MTISSETLSRDEIAWCLHLTWAGVTYRFCTRALNLLDSAGLSYQYHGGLADPEWAEEYDRSGASVTAITIPLEVLFPAPVDVAEYHQKGRFLDGAAGELFYVQIGQDGQSLQTIGERFRMMVGNIARPIWGSPERPERWAAFSLREAPYEDSSTIIPAGARINSLTWSTADQDDVGGAVYPYPVGRVGVWTDEDGIQQVSPGCPAYTVELLLGLATKMLVSGAPVAGTACTITDGNGTTESFTVTHEPDGLGRVVAVVDVSGGSSIDRSNGTYYSSWGSVSGGGVRSLFDAGPLSGGTAAGVTLEFAGDVIRWLFSLSSVQSNTRAWAAAQAVLNGHLKISTYIDDPEVSPWDWLQSNILPLLPVSAVRGVDGVSPVYEWRMQPAAYTVQIQESPEFQQTGALQSELQYSDAVNQQTIEFSKDASESSGYRRALTLGSPTFSATNGGAAPTRRSITSRSRYGLRDAVYSTEIITDGGYAGSVAASIMQRSDLSPISVAFYVSPWFALPQLGQRFRFSSDRLSIQGQTYVCRSRAWAGKWWRLVCDTEDDPIMRYKTT